MPPIHPEAGRDVHTNPRKLSGRLALVTGGGQRLGRAIAEGLADLGADVAVHCHSSRVGADAAVARIIGDGNRASVFQADLSQAEACSQLVEQVEQTLGPISILVNSAALYVRQDFVETSTATLDSQWALNVRAPFLLSQAVARRMLTRQGPRDIVNILDIGGTRNVWRHYSAYTMTKAALAMLTQSLALELAPHIRVNGVAPGTVLPPVELGEATLTQLQQRIPQGRFGAPDDIVQAVGFMLTGPSFMTGQIVAIDGGRSLAGA